MPIESEVVLIDAHAFAELKVNGDVAASSKVFIVHGNSHQLATSFLLGCSDYIKLPWSVEEAYCRIAKFNTERLSFTIADGNVVTLHPNYLAYELEHIPITPTESRILKILIQHKNTIVASHDMHHAITKRADTIKSNEIRVHIYNIRKKLEALPSVQTGKEIITTIPHQGYLFQGN